MNKFCLFLIVVFVQDPKKTYATPISNVDVNNFEDDWNFRIEPHDIPLLAPDVKNHTLPPNFKLALDEKRFVEVKQTPERLAKKLGDAVRSKVSCPVCQLGVGLLQREVMKDSSFEEIKKQFVGLCVNFKIQNEIVCTGIFDVFGPDVLAALKTATIGPIEICSLIFGEVCGDVKIPSHEWDVELPDIPKPDILEEKVPQLGLPTFKVLHLTDTHFDPDYVVGSVANCDEPLCCHSTSTPPVKGEVVLAGKWGSYEKCDSPKILLDNMLQHIAEEHKDIDYIIWTGDLPPHDIWNQSRTSNLDIIQATVEQMFEFFPKIPIFPAIGNHESIPAGNFAPSWMHHPNHSVEWLYTKVADHWRKWLPASAGNTVLHGAFYSVLVRPGFRIISLNTNYCHSYSWWVLVNSTDPAQELKWLINELQEAENKGEKVHIIGHIPPGVSDCMKVWSRNFNKIVERYENTIQAQFYGHTHNDEFEVFYDVGELRRPIGVAYLGPSVTTYENNNPAYRIYHVAGEYENSTKEVIDHETWTTDLEAANKNGEPTWYRLYSAKSAFNMTSLRPNDWSELINKFVQNSDLFEVFYKYYYRDSPTRPSCDIKCKLQILCDLRSARSHERHKLCHDLEVEFGS